MTEIIGILNITPDSFSDGGKYMQFAAALAQAEAMLSAGATIIDIGGESTRPGSVRVTPEIEQQRIMPLVTELIKRGVTVSVDTINAATAAAVLDAGVHIINDVSGGLHDPEMYHTVAAAGAKYMLGHWRGFPDPAHKRSVYADVTGEVGKQLQQLANRAIAAGIKHENIILDPGMGFDKTAQQGWQILAELQQLIALGYPVMIGLSRKRMVNEALQQAGIINTANIGLESTMAIRDMGSAAGAVLASQAGVWGVRVHDVASTAAALAVQRAYHEVAKHTVQKSLSQQTADKITLQGIEVYAHHGVFESERAAGQLFYIDAELTLSFSAAAAKDNIAATVDYGAVAAALHRAAAADPLNLLESLAERLAATALEFKGVSAVTITVHKPEAPITVPFSDVSFTVTRHKNTSFAKQSAENITWEQATDVQTLAGGNL